MHIINETALDELTAAARQSPRQRQNLNLHGADDACCHRLFNAIEPETYIQPHRHLDPAKDETFLLIRGRMGVVTFDEAGQVITRALLVAAGGARAATVPAGMYHTALSLEPGTIFFEAKAGPYRPLTPGERAVWAPVEGEDKATVYRANLQGLFP